MSTQTITKWFWLWQDEKEEEWLRSMAQQGLHLKELRLLNRYVFEEGTPQDVVYRLDFFTNTNKDQPGYLQIFRDAGWEHVAASGSWQYFRKPVKEGESLEIFTDSDSKVQKYMRLSALLVIFMVIFMPTLGYFGATRYGWIGEVIQGLRFLLLMVIAANLIMIAKRITELKKRT